MKALTVYQPWASLLAVGAKRYETRGWSTNYRGPIAIHAGTKKPSGMWGVIEGIIDRVRKALGLVDPDDLPRGAVIATAELIGCHRIHAGESGNPLLRMPTRNGPLKYITSIDITGDEVSFGDWTPGRYAWELANVKMLPEPIPTKGKQGLWEWKTA